MCEWASVVVHIMMYGLSKQQSIECLLSEPSSLQACIKRSISCEYPVNINCSGTPVHAGSFTVVSIAA